MLTCSDLTKNYNFLENLALAMYMCDYNIYETLLYVHDR